MICLETIRVRSDLEACAALLQNAVPRANIWLKEPLLPYRKKS